MATVRVRINEGLWIEDDADKEIDVFKAAARLTEVFQHTNCGKCKSPNVRFVCRKDKDENDWLEIVCRGGGCKLVFGATKGKGGVRVVRIARGAGTRCIRWPVCTVVASAQTGPSAGRGPARWSRH